MPEPLDREPASFVAGDTVSWIKSLSNYSAADGWTLNYVFRGNVKKTVTCSASGGDHVAIISATTSATYPPGSYTVWAYASKAGERYQVWKGTIVVEPDPATVTGSYDGRSHARKCLDAIETALEGNMSREESAYTINFGGSSRQLSLCSKADLIMARNYYLSEVRREDAAERLRQGRGSGNRVLVRFV